MDTYISKFAKKLLNGKFKNNSIVFEVRIQ